MAAQVTKEAEGLSFSRAYSLALAPQLIHARSELLSQLVSSKAFRQIEFLAVGSFYIYKPGSESTPTRSLSRIPSTREDVFANTAIPARAKRLLMKFLKFVLEYDSEPLTELWKPRAREPLESFLESEFKLDVDLRSYVITLTLSLDGKISVEAGLASINRHLTSMGVFGAGFAAVYPKWGGLSEVAQVGCRAGAVGGAVYMLSVGISDIQNAGDEDELSVTLANGVAIRSKALVQGSSKPTGENRTVSRLTAVVNSNLSSMFESTVEGAPTPCVAVVALPAGSITTSDGITSEFPTFALVHSSDTGECPAGQCEYCNSFIFTLCVRMISRKTNTYLHCLIYNDDQSSDNLMHKPIIHFCCCPLDLDTWLTQTNFKAPYTSALYPVPDPKICWTRHCRLSSLLPRRDRNHLSICTGCTTSKEVAHPPLP